MCTLHSLCRLLWLLLSLVRCLSGVRAPASASFLALSLAYTRTHTPARAHTYILSLSLSLSLSHIHTYTHDHTHPKILDCHWEMWISRTTTMTLCVTKGTKVRERHCMRLYACVNVRKRTLAHAQHTITHTMTSFLPPSLPPSFRLSFPFSLSPPLPVSEICWSGECSFKGNWSWPWPGLVSLHFARNLYIYTYSSWSSCVHGTLKKLCVYIQGQSYILWYHGKQSIHIHIKYSDSIDDA